MKVSIATKPNVYKLFRHLPNVHWNCLCEFIDNSLSARFKKFKDFKTKIQIDISKEKIIIMDDGPGIKEEEFARAFEPAHIPTDNNSLNEFGMGLKTASLFLGDRYKVETQRENSKRYIIEFDLIDVTTNEKSELDVSILPRKTDSTSFTQITIDKLNSSTAPDPIIDIENIKRKLSTVYKYAIKNGLKIYVNDDIIIPLEPTILNAPYFENYTGPLIEWKSAVSKSSGNYSITGFLSLLQEMNDSQSGLLLFRNGRVITGLKQPYKPNKLFAAPGSHLFKRLYGELELTGFDVSFNKDQIIETGELDKLINELAIDLNNTKPSLIEQGKKFRIKEYDKQKNTEIGKPEKSTTEKEKKLNQPTAIPNEEYIISAKLPIGNKIYSNKENIGIQMPIEFFTNVEKQLVFFKIMNLVEIKITEDNLQNLSIRLWQILHSPQLTK